LGLAAAAVHGIDLSPHRSVWLTPQMTEKASLLVVFDAINKAAVRDRYPDLRVPLILLGDLIELGEIGDPVDGSAADFALTYQRISVAIDELVVALRNAGKTRKLLSVGSSLALPGRRPC
jgi:protein-tyrosine-phosphatase